jgi:hypothetical protein
MFEAIRHDGAADFLARAHDWLLRQEDRHNLILSLAYARARREAAQGTEPHGAYFGTVEQGGDVVGCAVRTPPYKVLVTELPEGAAPAVAASLAGAFDSIPALLGPAPAAEAVAAAWVTERGGGWRPGLEQRIYRLDAVTPPTGVTGALRPTTREDLELAVAWGEGFARDAGQQFGTRRGTVEAWIEHGGLFLWEDDEPRSIAVAQGRTPNGIRVGYVYTPPESRGRGYASACVAALSQTVLDRGVSFCVLYTDLSNPTSNAIYQRIGYRPIADVRDVDVVAEGAT